MSTSLRWGDSDSSEDEIRVSDLQKQKSDEEDDGFFDKPPTNQQQQQQSSPSSLQQSQNRGQPAPPTSSNKARGRGCGRVSVGGRDSHQQQGSRTRTDEQQQGTRGRGHSGSSRQPHTQQDWKSMAKSASKYTPESVPAVDGSAWMASRRAKLQQHEEENKKKMLEDKQHEVELKRQHRKSQVEALTLALVERQKEATPVGVTSSLQAATAQNINSPKKAPVEDDISVQSSHSASSRGGGTDRWAGRGRGDDRGDSWRSTDGRGANDSRRDSWRSHDSGGGRGGRNYDGGSARGTRILDSAGHGRGGRGGRAAGAHPNSNSSSRKSAIIKGQVQVGKPQVVRTLSGDIQFHIEIGDNDNPNTQGELLSNGSVRLSKKGGTNKGTEKQHLPTHKVQHHKKSKSKSPTRSHTTLKTNLEIGKD